MMKKIVFVAAFLCTAAPLTSQEVFIELKGSGFFPTSHLFKRIYHDAGMIGAELSAQAYDKVYAWLSVDYLRKSGLSLIGNSKTKVRYLPIGFGLKYLHPFCYGDLYFGLGVLAARIRTHDFSPNVAPFYSKWGWGGIIKFGALFDIGCPFMLDVFVNYAVSRASSHNTFNNQVVPHTAKVNGVIFGGGLAYRF